GLAPLVEVGAARYALLDARVVEGVDQLLVDQDVRPARLVLQALDLDDEPAVMSEKGRPRLEIALDQRRADEDATRERGVEGRKVHPAVSVYRSPVERAALERYDLRAAP